MKLAVVGTGHLCLIIGACLSDVGDDLLYADTDSDRVNRQRAGNGERHSLWTSRDVRRPQRPCSRKRLYRCASR
jgi:hypothetical protein